MEGHGYKSFEWNRRTDFAELALGEQECDLCSENINIKWEKYFQE